jgi:hypothetical protein
MGGTSDLRDPCPPVKPVTPRKKRQPGTPAPLPHQAGMNVKLAGAVPAE